MLYSPELSDEEGGFQLTATIEPAVVTRVMSVGQFWNTGFSLSAPKSMNTIFNSLGGQVVFTAFVFDSAVSISEMCGAYTHKTPCQ